MSTPTMTMTTQLNDSFQYTVLDAIGDPVTQQVNLANVSKIVFGQTANTANASTVTPTKFYLNTHSITIASSTLDIDLSALTDIFGNVLNFNKVYAIWIKNNDASGGSGIIAKPGPSNGWTALWNGVSTGQQYIPAGGDFKQTAPYVGFNVTTGSRVLRLQNDAASPSGASSVTILIAGG